MDKNREDELEALATANGWAFSIEGEENPLETLPFTFFTNGVAHSAFNIIQGSVRDRGFLEFDYDWETLVGGLFSVAESIESSCAVTALAGVCPELMVSHETTSHWLEHPFTHEVFESEREEFARRFRVSTTDAAFAATILDPAMEQWLLDSLSDTDLCFEIQGSWLLCFTHLRPPAEVPAVIDGLVSFYEHIPSAAIDALPDPADA
ncbi:MAG: hypothetical protein ABI828_00610 [Actinomycetota bacterium]